MNKLTRCLIPLLMLAACGPGTSGDSASAAASSGSEASGSTDSASSASVGSETTGNTTGTTSVATGVAETGPSIDCDGQICGASEYCDWIMNSCGTSRSDEASCAPRPDGCDGDYAPVCGCDGQIHSNACAAEAAGVDPDEASPCTPPDGMTPCGWKYCDPGSQYCQTTPTDALPSPSSWSCLPLPRACGESPWCDCLDITCFLGSCEQLPDGSLSVHCPGG